MNHDYILPILTLVIFFVVIIILLVKYTDPPIPLSSESVCPIGLCSVHRLSGKKTCSSSGITPVSVLTEVCSSRTGCDSRFNPFAVQPNGSTLSPSDPNVSICPNGTACPCVNLSQCSENTTVYWSFENNNQVAIQHTEYRILGSNYKDLTPMSIPQGSTCTINRYLYERSAYYPENCLRGYMAFYTSNGTLTDDSPVGCFVAKNMADFDGTRMLVYNESTERFTLA